MKCQLAVLAATGTAPPPEEAEDPDPAPPDGGVADHGLGPPGEPGLDPQGLFRDHQGMMTTAAEVIPQTLKDVVDLDHRPRTER